MNNFPRELLHSSGAPMLLEPTRLMLAFQRPMDSAAVKTLLASFDLLLEDAEPEQAVPGEVVNHTGQRFFVLARFALTPERIEAIDKAGQALGLDYVAPVYRLAGEPGRRALLVPLPNVIVVRLRERDGVANELHGAVLAATNGEAEPKLQEVPEKSKYLNGFRYYTIANAREVNAYQLRQRLNGDNGRLVADAQYETMPLIRPTAIVPSDTLFTQQWDMTRIGAGGAGITGWDLGTGAASVVVCVLDEGVDLGHPDLRFSTPGINLGTMMPDGSPTGNHGTACAGIVAATFNNGLGVAGVAGNARIMPVAFSSWSDVEVAAGITWASANGADVISMSFGSNGWSHAIIDPAIQTAFNNDLVMAVATHNYNGPITYPATNPLVMAVGASDEIDNRKSPSSPDMETWWGSDFGAAISVVAPGVHIPTTDRRGTAGYNTGSGAAGDYDLVFNGTSSATPHVAGQAALIRAMYPTLTNLEVRALIERSAEKTGVVAYADTAGHPNGSWNQEMGYGRINVLRALDAADVMIKDAPGDSGAEPYTGGNFWDFSDIVVRINDDGVFVPSDPLRSKNVERGQANYIYVRVTNQGPRAARNVTVSTRITPYVGLQFVYPQDWTLSDAAHVSPAPLSATFASIAPGATVMAKFRIEAAQTETLYGWVAGHAWHPCLLAVVKADNDYAFTSAPLTAAPITTRLNNLAQRNLSVIDVLGSASASFHFVAGNRFNLERAITLMIDRSRLPQAMPLLLSLDDDASAFPLVDFSPSQQEDGELESCSGGPLVFIDTTRVQTRFGCCDGILTLAKGSRFDCGTGAAKLGKVTVEGGDVIVRGQRRYVEVKGSQAVVHVQKAPGALHAMSLQTTIPADAAAGTQYLIQVAQQNSAGATVGGAAMVYLVR
ncbi:MAG: S8 family serine peptidase [Pseudomonadota bacterium]